MPGPIGKHNRRTHGLSHTRLDNIFKTMVQRCYNPKCKKYYRYGARGIKICDEWRESKESFFKWAFESGYSPSLSIDRIDNDGDYSPKNCKWSTPVEQVRNRECTVRIEYDGKRLTIAEWADYLKISPHTISTRYYRKEPVENILSTSKLQKNKKRSKQD